MKKFLTWLLTTVTDFCMMSYEDARKYEHDDAMGIEVLKTK